jgi:hypothetical protein
VRHYDKLIAGVAILALLLSLVYLVVNGSRSRAVEQRYDGELARLRPEHPRATPLDMQPYTRAMDALISPYQVAASSNALAGFLVPERRVWCQSCRLPIPYDATNCPHCRVVQPLRKEVDPMWDEDGGGIPNSAEVAYGLNPLDPRDDAADSDGDGFKNVEEYRAGTDPMNPASHPDVDVLLSIESLTGRPLPMKFMGKTTLPNKKVRCQINIAGPGARTAWVDEGQRVGETEFVLVRYEERFEKKPDPKLGGMLREYDISRAILRRGTQEIPLVVNEETFWTDFDIVFLLKLDNSRYPVTGQGSFTLRGRTYRVMSVDSRAPAVVIRSDADGKELRVSKTSAEVLPARPAE